MKKIICKSAAFFLVVFLVSLCSANRIAAREYWGDDAVRITKGAVDITGSKGFTLSKNKVTITNSDGEKKTYKLSKNVVRLNGLGSAPLGFESAKSNKTEFKEWMTDVITDNCGGLGCMIVVKKGVIVRYYLCS